MEPIISPFWFYLISVLSGLHSLIFILLAILIISLIIMVSIYIDDTVSEHIKPIKLIIILVIVLSVIQAFIPSKETCYQMLATSLITPNNVEVVGDKTKDIVDYIVESVDKIMEKEDE